MSHYHTCTTVSLLRRPITNGRLSLYLDFYPAIRNPETMKMTRREYLGIYIFAKPRNDADCVPLKLYPSLLKRMPCTLVRSLSL